MASANPPCRVSSCWRNWFITTEKLCPEKACLVSGEEAIELASERALWAAYLESSEAMAEVSSRTSSTGRENHFSMDRFMSPYANQNITMTGSNEILRPATTSRARQLDTRTPTTRSHINVRR